MSDVVPATAQQIATEPIPYQPAPQFQESHRTLLWRLMLLAGPVLAEQLLHMLVGLNDTYLANHVIKIPAGVSPEVRAAINAETAAAVAAVGTVSYFFWLIGLLTGGVSTGSTAIIARATGARHRRLANSICGQSISAATIGGIFLFAIAFFFAAPIIRFSGLTGQGHDFALLYLKMLSISLPFITVMFVANACLRGAGDTFTPAITFIIVDIVNIIFSWGLTYGALGLPQMGFKGIAVGTVLAYISGGVIQVVVLIHGKGGLRLHLHRLRPHWMNLKRILRIGVPGFVGDFTQWIINFAMLRVINQMDATLVVSAAHNNAIKIESISYLGGFSFAIAATTMVGQSLGMRDPDRAKRSAYLAYAVGGGVMTFMGVVFITLGKFLASLLSDDPGVRALTAQCMFITGFCQIGFAAAMIFGGALRGAGDTLVPTLLNVGSMLVLRVIAVMIVVMYFKQGLATVWCVLAVDQLVRGCLMYGRFLNGRWKRIEV